MLSDKRSQYWIPFNYKLDHNMMNVIYDLWWAWSHCSPAATAWLRNWFWHFAIMPCKKALRRPTHTHTHIEAIHLIYGNGTRNNLEFSQRFISSGWCIKTSKLLLCSNIILNTHKRKIVSRHHHLDFPRERKKNDTTQRQHDYQSSRSAMAKNMTKST
jgi:hypothetical protein